jgi:hypothetical protein
MAQIGTLQCRQTSITSSVEVYQVSWSFLLLIAYILCLYLQFPASHGNSNCCQEADTCHDNTSKEDLRWHITPLVGNNECTSNWWSRQTCETDTSHHHTHSNACLCWVLAQTRQRRREQAQQSRRKNAVEDGKYDEIGHRVNGNPAVQQDCRYGGEWNHSVQRPEPEICHEVW